MAVVCHPINEHIPRPPRERLLTKWLHVHSVRSLNIDDGAGAAVKLRLSRIEEAHAWSLKLLCSDGRGASALIDAAAPCKVGTCNIVPRALSLVDGYQTGVLLEFEHDAPADVVRDV